MSGFHLGRDKRASLQEAAALVTDGALVALGGGLCARLPMALVRTLIRAGRGTCTWWARRTASTWTCSSPRAR